MAQKIDLKKTKVMFEQLLAQAKESVKVLETLKDEGLAKARSFVPPSRAEAQRLANEKLIASLKKIGLATRSEVAALQRKVDELASELKHQAKAKKKHSNE